MNQRIRLIFTQNTENILNQNPFHLIYQTWHTVITFTVSKLEKGGSLWKRKYLLWTGQRNSQNSTWPPAVICHGMILRQPCHRSHSSSLVVNRTVSKNACLQSCSIFAGSGAESFICIMGKADQCGHIMYQSLKKSGVCVLSFPSNDIYDRCIKTIGSNQFDTDEITASDLTAENASKVHAPRIKECFLNIACEF